MTLHSSRNKILDKIQRKLAGIEPLQNPSPGINSGFYSRTDLSPAELFRQEINNVSGSCTICNTKMELISQLKSLFIELNINSVFCVDESLQTVLFDSGIPFSSDIEDLINIEAGFTPCEFLISRLGSIMISSKQISGRRLNIFPPVHIVLGFSSQLVYDIDNAFLKIKQKYHDGLPSLISLITGPSRTADIEKTLILGAHGPKKLFVFLMKDN